MNSYNRVFYCCLSILAPLHAAVGQQSAGTLAVFRVTPDRAILSIESRTSRMCDGKKILFDNKCKVLALDNKYIFAEVGNMGAYRPEACQSGEFYWNTLDATKSLYKSGNISSVTDFADKWTVKLRGLFQETGFAVTGKQGEVLAGIFIGLSRYRVEAKVVMFRDINGSLSVDSDVPIAVDGQDNFFGHPDVIVEFRANQTPRAHEWHRQIDKLSWELQVPALVKLSIDNDTTQGIGSTIRTIRLMPFRGTEWLSGECGDDAKQSKKTKTRHAANQP